MRYLKTNLIFLITVFLFISCSSNQSQDKSHDENSPVVLEVEAVYDADSGEHLFKTSADTIPAGWTTIKFVNASPFIHFVFLDYLPGDRTSEDLLSEVSPVFQKATNLIDQGDPEAGMAAFGELPPWFGDLVFRGGPGFVSPGLQTEATLFMAPGNYVLECYIKNAEGTYHWNMGMHEDLHVTADTTHASAPENADISITTTDDGLVIDGNPEAGKNLVALSFQEDNPSLVARDVHVVEVNDGTRADTIAHWINFNNPNSLESTRDDPGPAVFVGGAHEMPKGNVVYFPLMLEAGQTYAWVTEQGADKFEYIEFTVPSDQGNE